MLLNAIWTTREDLRVDLEGRTMVIDSAGYAFADAGAWGRITDFTPTEAEEPMVLRETLEDQVRLTVMTEKPLRIEVWDTDAETAFNMNWTGNSWNISEGANDEEDDEKNWLSLVTTDIEVCTSWACQKMGMGFISPAAIRNGKFQIELIERDKFSYLSLSGEHVHYHSTDSKNFVYKFVTDHSSLPPIEELNAIYTTGSGDTSDNVVYVIYDDEDGPLPALARIFPDKGDLNITTYSNPSDDIVDMRWLVKTAIENDGLTSHLYLIYHDGDEGRKWRLFINMEEFFPKQARYLASE